MFWLIALFALQWVTYAAGKAGIQDISIELALRGGAQLPEARDASEYYDQFHLDYGRDDSSRLAGSLRGFIKVGNLSKLPQSDLFLKWLYEHLEKGPEPINNRLKPFYVRS